MATDPYEKDEAAPEQPAESPTGGVVLRTVMPVAEFRVPDHDIVISRYGTSVAPDLVPHVRDAAMRAGITLVEVK